MLGGAQILLGLTLLGSGVAGLSNDGNWTLKHEKGRCAIRGQCGKKSLFGFNELPCPDNGLAQRPEDATREKLVGICGDKWKDGAICCDDAQVGFFYFILGLLANSYIA